jgi:hypothetical protein
MVAGILFFIRKTLCFLIGAFLKIDLSVPLMNNEDTFLLP